MSRDWAGSRAGISERREKIVGLLRVHGALSSTELAKRFRCSSATIRRDILELEAQGEIRRFHGGVALEATVVERSFHDASAAHADRKKSIAEQLAPLIPDDAIIGLNGGSTTSALALRLMELQRRVTVVTNAVNIAHMLSDGGISVVVVGGALRPQNYETTGPIALSALDNLHLDWAVLGANGVDKRFGITATTEQEAAVGRAFAQQADLVVIAADSSKLGRTALFRMLAFGDVHYLASDDDGQLELKEWGLEQSEPGLWANRQADLAGDFPGRKGLR